MTGLFSMILEEHKKKRKKSTFCDRNDVVESHLGIYKLGLAFSHDVQYALYKHVYTYVCEQVVTYV